MSLVLATYVPEGIIMASDSRQSIKGTLKNEKGEEQQIDTVSSDNVTKTFLLESYGVGISNFGQDLLGGVPMASHIKRFSEEVLEGNEDVEIIASQLKDFISREFENADTGFHVCGYKKEGKISTPHVWYIHIGKNELRRRNLKPNTNEIAHGATWSGQGDIVTNLVNPVVIQEGVQQKVVRPVAPIIWDAMALQDAIDFSVYAIRTTIDTMRFQARAKNVGGPIDVLAILPDKTVWVAKKNLITNQGQQKVNTKLSAPSSATTQADQAFA